MYSRATPFEKSDQIIGTHQKIDRAARLILREIMPKDSAHDLDKIFPKIKEILKFEGKNGPDGIKMKSPGKDEPWHFVDPEGDLSPMMDYVKNHLFNLSEALKAEDFVRASFEAAWLAHAVTDALTPAHQYPMEEKIIEISGKNPSERDKVHKKIFLPGESWRKKVKNNWEYIGPKGVMSSHMLYEMGVATLVSAIAPRKIAKKPAINEIETVKNGDFLEVFEMNIKSVYEKDYFERFMKFGWTNSLARETRENLLPQISAVVAMAWLAAILEAKK